MKTVTVTLPGDSLARENAELKARVAELYVESEKHIDRVSELEGDLRQAYEGVEGLASAFGWSGQISHRDTARAYMRRAVESIRRHYVERMEIQEFEHSCARCDRPAKDTKRREIFDAMRTQCERCGKWWSTYTEHPHHKPDAPLLSGAKKKKSAKKKPKRAKDRAK